MNFFLRFIHILKDKYLSIYLLCIIGCGGFALGTLSFLILELTGKKELKPGLIRFVYFSYTGSDRANLH